MNRLAKIVLSLAAGSVLLACGLCGGCLYQGYREIPRIQLASDAFLDRLAAGQVEEAYAASTPTFKEMVSLEGFRKRVADYPVLTKRGGRTARSTRIFNGDQAEVIYGLPNAQYVVSVSISLRKLDDRWVLQGFGFP